MQHATALDIGGTKLDAAVVDEDGTILRRGRRPTPRTSDPEVLWAAVAGLLDDVRGGTEVVCGVGCGGPIPPSSCRARRATVPGAGIGGCPV